MIIKQFHDKNLAVYSYVILSEGQIAIIDPARNPAPYYEFAEMHKARILYVIETHPHADFISSHLEISRSAGAQIRVSKLLGANYPHQTFDDGDVISLGNIKLKAINTPGHSPDSICIVAYDHYNKPQAVFTGDTLFIGDCGRPDLREKAGAIMTSRMELASQMFHSLRTKLMDLPDHVVVYPAHGAGSLCGKSLTDQNSSTIGAEKLSNWSLQMMTEQDFISRLLEDQPYIPKYFPFDVALNRNGAEGFDQSIKKVHISDPINDLDKAALLDPNIPVIDTRLQKFYRKAHLKNSINLLPGAVFETWLGSIIAPDEKFYLAASDEAGLKQVIERIAKIGYENQIRSAFVLDYGELELHAMDINSLKTNEENFTIIDVRNVSEVRKKKIFQFSINIPLHELRERLHEIPDDKPVVVHCAAGFRSAAGSSIIQSFLHKDIQVFDLGDEVVKYQTEMIPQ